MSHANLADIIGAGVEFIAPASKTYVRAAELAVLDRGAATEVDYVAQRDARVPAAARGTWAVCEDSMTVTGKRIGADLAGDRSRPLEPRLRA